jgi:tetratricopeptide (TPR) repeat protein
MTDPAKSSGTRPDGAAYSLADVSRLFDIAEGRLRYWSQTGFITPSVRSGGRRLYAFEDLVAVKVARSLLDEGFSLQRVRRSLDALRGLMPDHGSPLSRLRLRSEHDRVVVDEAGGSFDAESGQLLLDFDLDRLREQVAEVTALPWVGASPDAEDESRSAYQWFLDGAAHEAEGRTAAAVSAYRRAVAIDPMMAAAHTNLGALAAESGDLDDARDHFEAALRCDPDQVEAYCNLAELALRAGDDEVALAGFRQVLRLDPDHHEAHYGLARALLRVGGHLQAFAHLERFCDAVEALPAAERDSGIDGRRARARDVLKKLRRELDRA